MNYWKDKPEEPGFYWFWEEHEDPEIVHVFRNESSGVLCVLFFGCSMEEYLDPEYGFAPGDRWWGPLPLPNPSAETG